MKYNVGDKIKLIEPLKTLCCNHIIDTDEVITIYSYKSLHRPIIKTKRVVINHNCGLHHVKISSIRGVLI